jgi:transcriptional regulator with XRE-family HTH domain
MPQRDLGRSVGVSLSAIQNYDRGENRIAASRLSALAEALKI